MACDETVKASEQLVEAARRLRQQPTSHQYKTLFLDATRKIHTGLLQVELQVLSVVLLMSLTCDAMCLVPAGIASLGRP